MKKFEEFWKVEHSMKKSRLSEHQKMTLDRHRINQKKNNEMRKNWEKRTSEVNTNENSIKIDTTSIILSFCKLRLDVNVMTDLRTLMNDSKKIVLMIIDAINCKKIFLEDKNEMIKAWIIQNESRTNYMFSIHSSTKAMTTD